MSSLTDRLEYRLAIARVDDPDLGWDLNLNRRARRGLARVRRGLRSWSLRLRSLDRLVFNSILFFDPTYTFLTCLWAALDDRLVTGSRVDDGLTSTLNFCLGLSYGSFTNRLDAWFSTWVAPSAGTLAGVDARLAIRRADARVRNDIESARAALVADRLSNRARRRAARLIDAADCRWARWAVDSLIALGDPDAIAARDADVADRLARRESARVNDLADLIGADFDRLLAYDAIVARVARISDRVAVARSVVNPRRIWGYVASSVARVARVSVANWSAVAWLSIWAPNLYGPFARPALC
jgi:hypothetical protein